MENFLTQFGINKINELAIRRSATTPTRSVAPTPAKTVSRPTTPTVSKKSQDPVSTGMRGTSTPTGIPPMTPPRTTPPRSLGGRAITPTATDTPTLDTDRGSLTKQYSMKQNWGGNRGERATFPGLTGTMPAKSKLQYNLRKAGELGGGDRGAYSFTPPTGPKPDATLGGATDTVGVSRSPAHSGPGAQGPPDAPIAQARASRLQLAKDKADSPYTPATKGKYTPNTRSIPIGGMSPRMSPLGMPPPSQVVPGPATRKTNLPATGGTWSTADVGKGGVPRSDYTSTGPSLPGGSGSLALGRGPSPMPATERGFKASHLALSAPKRAEAAKDAAKSRQVIAGMMGGSTKKAKMAQLKKDKAAAEKLRGGPNPLAAKAAQSEKDRAAAVATRTKATEAEAAEAAEKAAKGAHVASRKERLRAKVGAGGGGTGNAFKAPEPGALSAKERIRARIKAQQSKGAASTTTSGRISTPSLIGSPSAGATASPRASTTTDRLRMVRRSTGNYTGDTPEYKARRQARQKALELGEDE